MQTGKKKDWIEFELNISKIREYRIKFEYLLLYSNLNQKYEKFTNIESNFNIYYCIQSF